MPVVAVPGNHDHESGTPEGVAATLARAGVRVLDGEACEVHGVGIAGTQGFPGGFGRGSLGAWGEAAIKQFVREAQREAMEIYPFLGSSRLEEPLLRHVRPDEPAFRVLALPRGEGG